METKTNRPKGFKFRKYDSVYAQTDDGQQVMIGHIQEVNEQTLVIKHGHTPYGCTSSHNTQVVTKRELVNGILHPETIREFERQHTEPLSKDECIQNDDAPKTALDDALNYLREKMLTVFFIQCYSCYVCCNMPFTQYERAQNFPHVVHNVLDILCPFPKRAMSHESKRGRIELIMGSMFAGKTKELVRRYNVREIAGDQCLMVKWGADKRYAEDHVVTHDQDSVRAINCQNMGDIMETMLKADAIFVDEVQFIPDAVEQIIKLAKHGKRVVAAGLSGNHQGEPFPIVARMTAITQSLTLLHAVCMGCGHEASFTRKITDSSVEIEIGTHQYRPVCLACRDVPLNQLRPLKLKRTNTLQPHDVAQIHPLPVSNAKGMAERTMFWACVWFCLTFVVVHLTAFGLGMQSDTGIVLLFQQLAAVLDHVSVTSLGLVSVMIGLRQAF